MFARLCNGLVVSKVVDDTIYVALSGCVVSTAAFYCKLQADVRVFRSHEDWHLLYAESLHSCCILFLTNLHSSCCLLDLGIAKALSCMGHYVHPRLHAYKLLRQCYCDEDGMLAGLRLKFCTSSCMSSALFQKHATVITCLALCAQTYDATPDTLRDLTTSTLSFCIHNRSLADDSRNERGEVI